MLTDYRWEALLGFFRALSDATRLKMVGVLSREPRTVEQLAEELSLSPSTVSHHLKKLAAIGLVAARADGHSHVYSLQVEQLHKLAQDVLGAAASVETAAAGESGDEFERKTLRDFFEGGKLKTIPSQQKKRDVVLRRLAGLFEPGRQYAERDVNAILQDVHPDSASLRRYLVDGRFLARERGVYWRLETGD